MKALLCELILSCLLSTPGVRTVDDLTYGTALYAYYQEDPAQALLEVMVAEAQGRRGSSSVRFDLAKGSFAFKERMYGLARNTFESVAVDELTDVDRARLAFHLARERYRQQDWPGLERALGRVFPQTGARGHRPSHPEVTFMEAEAAIARGHLDGAADALENLETGEPYLAYGLFNLGVAFRSAGDLESAYGAFQRLADLPARDVETLDVVQRGRLALAVLARRTQRPLDAHAVLSRLPAAGRYRDVALAAYAGLAMDKGDFELAARIWLTLQRDSGWGVSAAAAQLGYPVSLEKLASPREALQHYQVAEQVFEQRLATLRQSARRVDDPAWVRRLLADLATTAIREPLDGTRSGADPNVAAQGPDWGDALGREDWLAWLASEDVHRLLVEWGELSSMADWLDRLPARLAVHDEVARERERRLADAAGLLDQQNLDSRRAVLAEQIDALSARLQTVKAGPAAFGDPWMSALATAEERALLETLAAMAHAGEQMPAAERPAWQRRVHRLRGGLFWQIADSRSSRIRNLENLLLENRALLAEADDRLARLAGAQARFAAGVKADFSRFGTRAAALRARVADAREAREARLAAALRGGLQREAQALEGYLLTARIAIARTSDQLASRGTAADSSGGS